MWWLYILSPRFPECNHKYHEWNLTKQSYIPFLPFSYTNLSMIRYCLVLFQLYQNEAVKLPLFLGNNISIIINITALTSYLPCQLRETCLNVAIVFLVGVFLSGGQVVFEINTAGNAKYTIPSSEMYNDATWYKVRKVHTIVFS